MQKQSDYLSYAENDYEYFKWSYFQGVQFNQMCAIATQACEKYLKHLVEEHCDLFIENKKEAAYVSHLLHSHDISGLLEYLSENDINIFSTEEELMIAGIEKYYKSAGYPGDDFSEIHQTDIDKCNIVLDLCRDKVLNYLQNQNLELDEKDVKDKERGH